MSYDMKTKTVDIKTANEEKSMQFEGIATTYGNADREGDIIVKGAFENFENADTIELPLLYSHDATQVIGKIKLTNTDEVVLAEGTFLPGSELAKNIYEMVSFGAVSSLSIGFITKEYEPVDSNNRFGGMYIQKAELVETSVVAIPANPKATISKVKTLNPNELQVIVNLTNKNIVVEDSDCLEDYKRDLLSKL